MSIRAAGLIAGVVLSAVAAAAQARYGFDPPLKKQVIDFGESPYYTRTPDGRTRHTDIHVQLRCYYYRGLMVKEYDDGQKGAKSLSFLRFDQARPACVKEHVPAEKVLDYHEWSGYFKGVKGDFVFFISSDGDDGGMPFAIYDTRTGKKIFEDNAYQGRMWNKEFAPLLGSPFDHMRVRSTPDGNIVLTYLRVLGTECDIPKQADECWSPVVEKLGLKATAVPRCTGYEKITSPYPSSLAYPVEVSLLPTPTTRVIAGPIKCWPVD